MARKNVATGEVSTGSSVTLSQEVFENDQHVIPDHPKGLEYENGHHFSRREIDRSYHHGDLTKVNGQEAFSQAQQLYKGIGRLGEFWVDPKVDPNTGKVPAGKFVDYDYPTYRGPREQHSLEDIVDPGFYPKHTNISPLSGPRDETRTYQGAIHTTWRDLREQLGTGMGVRTNKYLIEFSLPIFDSPTPWKVNVLCKSTSMPQRQMHTTSLWRFGRKYNLRGETNFGDTWTLTFEEDSSMTLRKAFDHWFREIDDSRLQHTGLNVYNGMGDPMARLETKVQDLVEREETSRFDLGGTLNDAVTSLIRPEYTRSAPNYQTDIRVYQLDQNGNKVMGYVMQNAFVSDIGSIEYGDEKQNELVTFPVTFTFSEFLPLTGNVLDGQIRVFK